MAEFDPNAIARRMRLRVNQEFEATMDSIVARVERELLREQAKLFRWLATQAIGQRRVPPDFEGLMEAPIEWAPLSKRTKAAKGHDRFFLHTGQLQRTVYGKNAIATLGPPKIREERYRNGRIVKGSLVRTIELFPRVPNKKARTFAGLEGIFGPWQRKKLLGKPEWFRPLMQPFMWYAMYRLKDVASNALYTRTSGIEKGQIG